MSCCSSRLQSKNLPMRRGEYERAMQRNADPICWYWLHVLIEPRTRYRVAVMPFDSTLARGNSQVLWQGPTEPQPDEQHDLKMGVSYIIFVVRETEHLGGGAKSEM
ncbi:expressed unknown protein [Seminavis robusta]|uniref:Uncharacterized protein n=1 Tax=Seminavis robusta TaxID=568900 RepID=A0A9N8HVT8_9STRA|nr:expressed unknown protein [Seminavis robusta]|eukprot:Sro2049_g312541.1  (106) ;mRNA; f:8207-8524